MVWVVLKWQGGTNDREDDWHDVSNLREASNRSSVRDLGLETF